MLLMNKSFSTLPSFRAKHSSCARNPIINNRNLRNISEFCYQSIGSLEEGREIKIGASYHEILKTVQRLKINFSLSMIWWFDDSLNLIWKICFLWDESRCVLYLILFLIFSRSHQPTFYIRHRLILMLILLLPLPTSSSLLNAIVNLYGYSALLLWLIWRSMRQWMRKVNRQEKNNKRKVIYDETII